MNTPRLATQPRKECPRCRAIAPLDAPRCAQCGHAYRTKFAPAPEPTQEIQPVRPQQPAQDSSRRFTPTEMFSPARLRIGAIVVAVFIGLFVVRQVLRQVAVADALEKRGSVQGVARRVTGRDSDTVRSILGEPDRIEYSQDMGSVREEVWVYRCRDGVAVISLRWGYVTGVSGRTD